MTGLPVTRVVRQIDPLVRRSDELGFLNGHVPVTAVITAAALVAAVLEHRDAVVLSNEWSASVPTLVADGHAVNHQWSKSEEFERGFAEFVLTTLGPGPSVFSYLRPRSELWVSEQFAHLTGYHRSFRSCNRAFHQDPARRLDHWCGRCDKCCFVDLVLAPFMDRSDLGRGVRRRRAVGEPGQRGALPSPPRAGRREPSRSSASGDTDECRAAALLAAQREDRATTIVLRRRARASWPRPHPPPCRRRRFRSSRGEPIASRIAMRQPISWSALADASVGVWGLGVEGRASIRRLRSLGVVPVLVDDAPASATLDGLEVRATAVRGPDARWRSATSWSRAPASAATDPRWRSSRRPG